MDDETVDEASAGTGAEAPAGDELLALAREALIAANPEAVPELIAGATAAELRASLAAARAAYARAAERARAEIAAQGVPAGGSTRTAPVSMDGLSPSAKIAAGLTSSR